jgi:hypothetical protein
MPLRQAYRSGKLWRHWIASATLAHEMRSVPARSAMLRATLSTR